MISVDDIVLQVKSAVREIISTERDDLPRATFLVVGCSTSEIAGGQIGRAGQPELGEVVAEAVISCASELGVRVAFQCCEHLNRALVIEEATADELGLERVCVVPHPKAGGSCASAAYRLMSAPAVVERISADAGLDIGLTLIGMHMRPVAVPIRLNTDMIGMARVVAARSRPKLIGGERAKYTL